MDAQLVVFLAFVAVALIINTAIIFLAYKIFADLSTKFTEGAHEFQSSPSTREWLTTLQSTSAQAAKITSDVRNEIVGFETSMQRMQASYEAGLARADVRLSLIWRAIHFAAETTERLVTWPIRGIHSAMVGIQGVFDFIRGSQSNADARSRRNR